MKKVFSICLIVLSVGLVADDDRGFFSKVFGSKTDIATLKDTTTVKLYKNECGSCHIAYQSEFLPKRSWQKMMKNLENHFGVDASLDKEDQNKITKFLEENSADSKKIYGEFKEFFESIDKKKTPLKISEIPYFKKEHKKIPKKYITQKEVKTIANCTACHKDANKATFSEKAIDIPNYGKWED